LAEEDSSRPETAGAISRPRIQALSDLIFGLALSIGALSLLAPKPESTTELAYSLLGFGWAFVILALVWVRYTRVMSLLPVETGSILSANLLLLFLVSIEPYLYTLLSVSYTGNSGTLSSQDTTALYALDMGSMFLILAYFTHELTREERGLVPKERLRNVRLMRNATIVTSTLFLVSILPVFWSIEILGLPSRFIIWMGTFVVMLIRRGLELRIDLTNHKQEPI
jgi:uncharacterized membrane protein